MNNLKILRSIEDAIIEVFVWTFLFPITFVDLIFNHVNFLDKMSDELRKADGAGFETRMSPVSFMVYGTALPLALYIKSKGFITGEGLATMPNVNDALMILMILFSLLPFAWAVIHMSANIAHVSRSVFREYFAALCYVFTPFYVAILWVVLCTGYYAITSHRDLPFSGWYMLLVVLLVVIWLFVVQWRLLYRRVGLLKSFIFFSLGFVLCFFICKAVVVFTAMTGQKWI